MSQAYYQAGILLGFGQCWMLLVARGQSISVCWSVFQALLERNRTMGMSEGSLDSDITHTNTHHTDKPKHFYKLWWNKDKFFKIRFDRLALLALLDRYFVDMFVSFQRQGLSWCNVWYALLAFSLMVAFVCCQLKKIDGVRFGIVVFDLYSFFMERNWKLVHMVIVLIYALTWCLRFIGMYVCLVFSPVFIA